MARYRRVLRVVINGLAGLSLLFGSLPAPVMRAAPPLSQSASIDASVAELDRLSSVPTFPPVALRSALHIDEGLAGWYLRPPAAIPARPAVERSSAPQAARAVRDFAARPLPAWAAAPT